MGKNQNREEQWAFIASAAGDLEAGIIEELLKANEIPVRKEYREAGGFLQICMGMTNFGIDLYVPVYCLETAKRLLEECKFVNTEPE